MYFLFANITLINVKKKVCKLALTNYRFRCIISVEIRKERYTL